MLAAKTQIHRQLELQFLATMAVLALGDDMDNEPPETIVSVHSPLIQFSSRGNYYTTYAISLRSTHPCFTLSYSHLRRRYSEFAYLRSLLKLHHPTVEPPPLPPKNYFYRFNRIFIEERQKGLEKFLEDVLRTSVYLSDKSLHLFLQSSLTMSQIDEQCLGDVPAPQLIDAHPFTLNADSSSSVSSEQSDPAIENLSSNNKLLGKDAKSSEPDSQLSSTISSPIPITKEKRRGSLKKATKDNFQSSDSSDSGNGSLDSVPERHVSFRDTVTVAVVSNQLWYIDEKPIKAGA